MNKIIVFLVFIAGFIAGIISMVMLLDMQHYTTALALNYTILRPVLGEILYYALLGAVIIVCIMAMRSPVQVVRVLHETKSS